MNVVDLDGLSYIELEKFTNNPLNHDAQIRYARCRMILIRHNHLSGNADKIEKYKKRMKDIFKRDMPNELRWKEVK